MNLSIQMGETTMSKIIFNMTQDNQLKENPSVASASERSIQYTAEFNVKAVRENMEDEDLNKSSQSTDST